MFPSVQYLYSFKKNKQLYYFVEKHSKTIVSFVLPVLLPAAPHAVESDPLLEHAHPQALLEPARLARLPPPLVDLAVVGRRAGVLDVS